MFGKEKMSDRKFQEWRDLLYRSGDMGAIKLGVSQDDVIRTLGEADRISVDPTGKKATVLVYGDFQFFFDLLHGRRLSEIHTPNVDRIPLKR